MLFAFNQKLSQGVFLTGIIQFNRQYLFLFNKKLSWVSLHRIFITCNQFFLCYSRQQTRNWTNWISLLNNIMINIFFGGFLFKGIFRSFCVVTIQPSFKLQGSIYWFNGWYFLLKNHQKNKSKHMREQQKHDWIGYPIGISIYNG